MEEVRKNGILRAKQIQQHGISLVSFRNQAKKKKDMNKL